MPATDVDFEREFEELVRDLRALPTAAPEHVREHVRALGGPPRPRTLHELLLILSWRRSLLVLAPVCVLVLVSAAVIHGVLNSGPGSNPSAAAQKLETGGAHSGAVGSGGTATTPVFGTATSPPAALASPLPTPAPGRYQSYEASLTVRVKHVDTLHEASLSRISLTLTSQQAPVAKKGGMGRIERAARDAGSFLAGAGAVVLFVLIVVSPLIVLAVAWVLGFRAYRRREARRLLS